MITTNKYTGQGRAQQLLALHACQLRLGPQHIIWSSSRYKVILEHRPYCSQTKTNQTKNFSWKRGQWEKEGRCAGWLRHQTPQYHSLFLELHDFRDLMTVHTLLKTFRMVLLPDVQRYRAVDFMLLPQRIRKRR